MDMISEESSFYATLGIQKHANFEEIEAAYLCSLEAIIDGIDDLSSHENEERRWQRRNEIERAFNALGDPKRRSAYDSTSIENSLFVSSKKTRKIKPIRRLPIGERAKAAAEAVARSYQLRKEVVKKKLDDSVKVMGEESELNPSTQGEDPSQKPILVDLRAAESHSKEVDEVNSENEPEKIQKIDDFLCSPVNQRDHKVLGSAVERLSKRFEAFNAKAKQNEEKESEEGFEVPLEYTGEILSKLRQRKGASLQDVSAITKINIRYLAAIEAQDFMILPAPVYIQGFIHQYAKLLGLETQKVVLSYMSQYSRNEKCSGSKT